MSDGASAKRGDGDRCAAEQQALVPVSPGFGSAGATGLHKMASGSRLLLEKVLLLLINLGERL